MAKKQLHFVLPPIIQIGAIPVRVKDGRLNDDELGCYDSGTSLITIDMKKLTSDAHVMVCLLHEVGHAIDYVYNLKRTDGDVDRCAHGYAQAFFYIAEAQKD